jgi:hypothetical protein
VSFLAARGRYVEEIEALGDKVDGSIWADMSLRRIMFPLKKRKNSKKWLARRRHISGVLEIRLWHRTSYESS